IIFFKFQLLGAFFIPLLHGQLDFFNGIYFAFICLTAIEYGDLVPDNNWYIPIVILYVCIGLAISTIALGESFSSSTSSLLLIVPMSRKDSIL
ncbi:Ion channel, partial [Cooperia oncophora]